MSLISFPVLHTKILTTNICQQDLDKKSKLFLEKKLNFIYVASFTSLQLSLNSEGAHRALFRKFVNHLGSSWSYFCAAYNWFPRDGNHQYVISRLKPLQGSSSCWPLLWRGGNPLSENLWTGHYRTPSVPKRSLISGHCFFFLRDCC